MSKKTRGLVGEAARAVGKDTGRVLKKTHPTPLWVILLLGVLVVFAMKFPDQGSYYDIEQAAAMSAQEPQPEPTALASAMLATASGGPIRGMDASKWQPPIDWDAVFQSGIKFAFIKCTEGVSYIDPSFADHWAGAKNAGLLVSAYHLLWPNLSASRQAAHFLSTMGDREADFPLALDVELRKGMGRFEAGPVVEEVLVLLEAGDGRKPIVYTAQSVWGEIVGWAPGWKDYYLWVADYDAIVPAQPTGWVTYHFHQHSSTGSVPGVRGNVDLNTFIGSREALMALGR